MSSRLAPPALAAAPRVRSLECELDPSSDPVRKLTQMHELTGLPLSLVDGSTGSILAALPEDSLRFLPPRLGEQLTALKRVQVSEWPSGLVTYAAPLMNWGGAPLAVAGCMLARAEIRPTELVLAAAEHGWSCEELDDWLRRLPHAQPSLLERLLESALAHCVAEAKNAEYLEELCQLGNQIDYTYEEITLLHALTQNLQISRSPEELAVLCLERLRGLVGAGANIIWLEPAREKGHFLVDGQLPFDQPQMERLIERFDDHDWSRPLVKNKFHRTLLGASYPGLRNLMIVPIAEGTHRSGWIVSCNLDGERDYGTVEGSLLGSIATILGTHLRNIDLYQQHEELMLSFVRSLVSSLDAKDPYTRGHSERVALIGRKLGRELGLPEEDLQDIYLAGLLHDIGKIGVDDRILQKPGQLTGEEFAKIQKHPMIGYSILKGLRNLQRILPGVRNHHETYNGVGYPDRLQGEQIPLMARILAVADSYDAMGSNRPYRDGMPLEALEDIFRRGSGKQWDPRVIDAYFGCRDAIKQICDDYCPAHGNLLGDSQAD